MDDEESKAIVRWVQDTQTQFPSLQFIDSIHNLNSFLQRTYSYEVGDMAIANSNLSNVVSVPDYYLLPKGENLLESLKKHSIPHLCYSLDMQLPILVKPQWTVGNPESHIIDILLSESALPSCYSEDMVVQSYKDHNGVIYKAYAIANSVFLEKRISLPNVEDCSVPIFSVLRIRTLSTSTKSTERRSAHSRSVQKIIHPLSIIRLFTTKVLLPSF